MTLYNDVIRGWEERISDCDRKNLDFDAVNLWEDVGKNNMVLRSDMAYELGGASNKMYALGSTVITGTDSLVPRDEVILVGKDLPEITEDTSYTRLTVVLIDENAMGEGDALYSAIRNIEYVRYQINPKGFMMRVSTSHNRESVRVSKESLENGMTFSHIGKAFVEHLKKNPKVKAVKVIFITEPEFNYKDIEKDVLQAEAITKTIDHVFKNVSMDCNVCNLKEVCDEVEGLKELHFKNANGSMEA